MVFYSVIINWIRGNFEISCDVMIELINKQNAIVIDIRDQNDYNSGYIINSINTPFTNIKNDKFFLCKKFKSNPVIVVDNNTESSYSAKQFLNKLGFVEIYILKRGINGWKAHDFPLLSKK